MDTEESEYALGFQDGMMQACNLLRDAAAEYKQTSTESKKVLESQANELANVLLLSWANAIEIACSRALKNAG